MAISDRSLSSQDIVRGLTGGWGAYNLNTGNMYNTVTCLSRLTGKLRNTFFKGPCQNSKILTPDKINQWPSVFRDKALKFFKEQNLYGFCLFDANNEGASVWLLTPDDSFAPEGAENNNDESNNSTLSSIINTEIAGRKWMTAVSKAQQQLPEDMRNNPPFALMGVLSVSFKEIPWFGRVAWGTGYANGILSLTQIPTMNDNKSEYCTWSFVCKDSSYNEERLYKEFTQGGNESTYTTFAKYRDFLLSDKCEPANQEGDYSFLKDKSSSGSDNLQNTDSSDTSNSEEGDGTKEENNPLIDAAKKEGFFRSRQSSFKAAMKHIVNEVSRSWGYGRDSDDDPNVSSDTTTTSPKSSPFVYDIKRNGQYPIIGSLY